MTNQYHKVAAFVNDAGVEELRGFFLDMLKFDPAATIHVLNYGDAAVTKAMMEEVMALLHAGQKIAAIKAHRHHSGLGLKDSKEAVEAIIAERFPVWPIPQN